MQVKPPRAVTPTFAGTRRCVVRRSTLAPQSFRRRRAPLDAEDGTGRRRGNPQQGGSPRLRKCSPSQASRTRKLFYCGRFFEPARALIARAAALHAQRRPWPTTFSASGQRVPTTGFDPFRTVRYQLCRGPARSAASHRFGCVPCRTFPVPRTSNYPWLARPACISRERTAPPHLR